MPVAQANEDENAASCVSYMPPSIFRGACGKRTMPTRPRPSSITRPPVTNRSRAPTRMTKAWEAADLESQVGRFVSHILLSSSPTAPSLRGSYPRRSWRRQMVVAVARGEPQGLGDGHHRTLGLGLVPFLMKNDRNVMNALLFV